MYIKPHAVLSIVSRSYCILQQKCPDKGIGSAVL